MALAPATMAPHLCRQFFSSNTVSLIDATINTIAATISVGNSPVGIRVTPDGSRVYFPNLSRTMSE